MWLRGVLADQHGVAPDAVRWITFEDAHVAEYRDPPCAERAPAGAELTAMRKGGEIDAGIFGNELPDEPGFRPVFADPAGAGEAFRTACGVVPVNRLAVLRRDVVEAHPEAAAELVRLFAAPGLASSRTALAAPIALASRCCAEQGLTPRVLTLDEVWEGLPAGVG